jgi:N,N'-diacetyllegionaminate synthase
MSKLHDVFANPQSPCFFIAELGVNHNGSLDLAKQLIDVAADAGADAVKFQTFKAEKLVTRSAARAKYQVDNNPDGPSSQFEMLKRLELSKADLLACQAYCAKRDIIFLSTPFDEESADLLEEANVDGFKVSSGDLTNLPFLAHLAGKGLPIILSTGMAHIGEVMDGVEIIRASGNPPLAILHCVSNYPAAPADANLRAMATMSAAFGVPIGWSDHTLGDAITLASVALGARIIEKHYTLDKNMEGPDHKASLEPDELKELIEKIRSIEASLGNGQKWPVQAELDTARVARRSIVSAELIKKGHVIAASDLVMKRPGTGLTPKMLPLIVGRTATRDIEADEMITIGDVQ